MLLNTFFSCCCFFFYAAADVAVAVGAKVVASAAFPLRRLAEQHVAHVAHVAQSLSDHLPPGAPVPLA